MISGKLIADFSSVPTEAEKAIAALGSMAKGATDVTTALDRITPPAGVRQLATEAPLAQQAMAGLSGALSQTDQVLASLGIHIGPQVRALSELSVAAGSTFAELGLVATAGLTLGAGVAGWGIGRAVSGFLDLDKTIGDATAKLLGWGDVAAQEAAAGAGVLARASKEVGFQVTDMGTALIINQAALKDWQAAAKTANDDIVRLKAPEESAKAIAVLTAELGKLKSAGLTAALATDIQSHVFSVKELAERYRVSSDAIEQFTRDLDATEAAHVKNAAALKKAAEDIARNDEEAARRRAKAIEEIAHLDNDYEVGRVAQDGTATEVIIANNHRVTEDKIAQLTRTGVITDEIRDRLARNEKQANDAAMLDQRAMHTGRIADAQDELAQAERTLNAMIANGGFYRAEIDLQRAKVLELADAARAGGQAAVDAEDAAAAATRRHTDELDRQTKAAAAARQANRDMGNSIQYDFSTEEGRAKVPPDVAAWLHVGYSLEQAVRLALLMQNAGQGGLAAIGRDPLLQHPGPRVPGFAGGVTDFGGGMALVGERGPELVSLPRGSDVLPLGRGGGVTVYNTFHIVDTEANITRRVSQAITRSIMQGQKLTAA
jgi:hypothetical protein